MQFITRAYGATKLLAKANAPTIMVTTGVIAMGAGAVLACNKTLALEEVLKPHATQLEEIEAGEGMGLEGYTKEVARTDRVKVYTRVVRDSAKLYAVPGVLFFSGTALVFGGHRIMLQRNATLALAYTGLKKSFDAYRARVVNQWGSEADQAMMGGYHLEKVTDPEGNEHTLVERDWESAAMDPYNRVFGEGETREWVDDLGANTMFIHNVQRSCNLLLDRQGHLYLSDVYKALGFPETDISRVVGWKVRHKPDGSRDIPFVDFGLDKPHPDDWKYGRDKAIYLDFNCQGLIVGGRVQKALEKA